MKTVAALDPLLSIDGLTVRFPGAPRPAVRDVSLTVAQGETVAIVGESGSGKTLTALSAVRLTPEGAQLSGKIRLGETDVLEAGERALRGVRGGDVGMIFQEPMSSLNPLHTVEKQIGEALSVHQGLSGAEARERVLDLLRQVGIPEPETRLASFPHQLSGGQRQRVMIAMALANEPKMLIADEPTTALDVTIQAQILTLLRRLQTERGMAMLFITHDLNIVRKIADRVLVMKDGAVVETGPTETVFETPEHPYTRMLLDAEPTGAAEGGYRHAPEVVAAKKLRVWFPIKRGVLRRTVGHVKAVREASVTVREGETLGIVGESGSGKTTLGLALLRLIPSEGEIALFGERIDQARASALRERRRDMQIVFQDPFGALSPRMSVADIIGEGLDVHGVGADDGDRRRMIDEILVEVGLEPAMADRYPHEFSGGQRQRIAIARAMILSPRLVILDEPTSALDRTVQRQIIELLRDLQRRRKLSYLFISHDLAVVRAMAHRVIVMRNGDIVETGETASLMSEPKHPYTQALMAAAFDLEVRDGAGH